jgi:SAM-dependent methyltransferase
VAGIPDFRIFPDPWIGLEEDRTKALRLEQETEGLGFEDTIRAYWTMTPTTPKRFADGFVRHLLHAVDRSAEWLESLDPDSTGNWIDLGCGTGDLLVAAPQNVDGVGVDIAMRWLVAAKKRVEWNPEEPNLVCCCVEALPFADATFDRALSLGLIEHCRDPNPVAQEIWRVLKPGACVNMRTVNRFSILPEPHVNVWGVGFLPRRWADGYVRWKNGQRYLHHRPNSRHELARVFGEAGFLAARVEAASFLKTERGRLGKIGMNAVGVYGAIRGFPLFKYILSWVAPILELRGKKPE